jgi:membrane protein DedA with SNARE-associated domain
MHEEVVYYIIRYGYIAIFTLIFLQEIGMPNPFPNELLLIFTGYLTFKGLLFLPFVILTAISADFLGTNILYFLFFNAGTYIIQKKPSWFPLSARMLDQLTTKITEGGKFSIFLFRLTPFTRGYTSVITGLLRVKPKVFLPIAMSSGMIWASIYVIIGRLIGPSWNKFSENLNSFRYVLLGVLALALCIVFIIVYYRKRFKQNVEAGINNS